MLNVLTARMNISLRKGYQKAVLLPPCWSETFILANVLTIDSIGLPAKRANHTSRIHLGLGMMMLRLPGMFILSGFFFSILFMDFTVMPVLPLAMWLKPASRIGQGRQPIGKIQVTVRSCLLPGLCTCQSQTGKLLMLFCVVLRSQNLTSMPSPDVCEVMNNDVVKLTMDKNLRNTYEGLVNLM